MANKLYISEFAQGVSGIGTTLAQIPPAPAVANQIVAVGGASTPSAAFNAKTTNVILVTDTACCIKFSPDGTAPTADNTKDMLLPANVPMRFGVNPGAKVACITP